MMRLLSSVFGVAFSGFSWSWLIMPALGGLAMLGAHTQWQNFKDGLRNEGDRRCTARYEQQIRDEERGIAAVVIQKERGLLEGERRNNEELHNELERISGEYRELRATFDPNTSDRCLSDSVFEKLGGGSKDGPKPANAEPKSGAAAGSATAPPVPKDRPRRKKAVDAPAG
jgi:hypothetical protein